MDQLTVSTKQKGKGAAVHASMAETHIESGRALGHTDTSDRSDGATAASDRSGSLQVVAGSDSSHLAEQLAREAGYELRDLSEEQQVRMNLLLARLVPPSGMKHHASVASAAKRIMDIAGALAGLAFSAVVAVPVGLAIRLDSDGPVLFRQTRIGLCGEPFIMWKFRTMAHRRDEQFLSGRPASGFAAKDQHDTRITRVGRILRSTSLDELPQFWNVLKGDMSLVGTRPPVPNEVRAYERDAWDRLEVKPGLTGEWQVSGRSDIQEFDLVLELDRRYREHWSLGRDLSIIARTIPAVLRRAGAI